MCGLAGFWRRSSISTDQARSISFDMIDQIRHRGPDDAGFWVDEQSGIALGHRRLAIVDLSSAGHQPMSSHCGRFVIAYNGEIYNFRELRQALHELGAVQKWRGNSDTEVILAAFAHWGIQVSLSKFRGMFAFALWDNKDQSLTLARDPIGEKPLYFGWQGRGADRALLFGSELASLFPYPGFERKIDKTALLQLLRHNYVPAPRSIVAGVQKVMPGQMLRFSGEEKPPEIIQYWDSFDEAENARGTFEGTPEEAVDQFDDLLSAVVKRQMIADVPLGAFLSGGVDSSLIVAMMQKQSARSIQTFTIGFEQREYNEATHAKAVAEHLGTNHTELYITAKDALGVVEKIPDIYSEPFADSSQIPTYLVSALARTKVTVSLSGDGGDELFSGYSRYPLANKYWSQFSTVPDFLRTTGQNTIGKLINSVPEKLFDNLGRRFSKVLPSPLGRKVYKANALFASQNILELYVSMISHITDNMDLVPGAENASIRDPYVVDKLSAMSNIEKMMAVDIATYLPDDILAKVDRAAMAVSLESRVPLLDPDIIRFAWSLSPDLRIKDGQTKWPLRQLLYRHVPKHLIERPKMGFGIPFGSWLQNDLNEWASDLLNADYLEDQGLFDTEQVLQIWSMTKSGMGGNPSLIWSILMFQAWCRRYNF